MNPLFQALTGGSGPLQNPMGSVSQMMPNAGFGGIFGQAQRLAGMLQNPQGLVRQFFADAPAEVAQDPDQLLNWMVQTGRTNPQAVQMVRGMLGR